MGNAGSVIVQRFHKFMHIVIRHIDAEALALQAFISFPIENTVNDHIAQLLRVVAGLVKIVPVLGDSVHAAEVIIPSAGGA